PRAHAPQRWPERHPARSAGGRGAPGEHPVRPREVAGVAVRVLQEVVLVLGLGLPERAGRLDGRHGLARPQARRVHVGDRVASDLLLLRREREDGRAVAGPDVVALTVQRRRVVDLEEERQDVAVGRLRGIEDDLHRLGVAGMVAVRRMVVLTTGVTDPGLQHAGLAADEVLHAPEAPSSQDGRLGALDARDLAGVVDSTGHVASPPCWWCWRCRHCQQHTPARFWSHRSAVDTCGPPWCTGVTIPVGIHRRDTSCAPYCSPASEARTSWSTERTCPNRHPPRARSGSGWARPRSTTPTSGHAKAPTARRTTRRR